ncbi:DEKNAAC102736 [Brettanomyces naardenensis]|uniref:DEKNAAC102736 n=1 Tax=Brettanomyces naardenensis TaxID=13370 RepID=A0A448YKF5_BRENA|nr:DEKNAAC102736 [Brettanomyces naardenensis]
MDGTLTKPQTYMFKEMREALNILNKPVDILEYIASLDENEKEVASKKVQNIEYNAMLKMQPQAGVEDLFKYMNESTPLKFTICTRNNFTPVNYLLDNYLGGVELHSPVITRSFEPPKPSPKPLLHISESWGIDPKNLIMVGDSRDDMFAGLQAGFSLVLMRHKDNAHLVEELPEIDYVIDDFHQLIEIVQTGFEVKPKVPRAKTNFSGY